MTSSSSSLTAGFILLLLRILNRLYSYIHIQNTLKEEDAKWKQWKHCTTGFHKREPVAIPDKHTVQSASLAWNQ